MSNIEGMSRISGEATTPTVDDSHITIESQDFEDMFELKKRSDYNSWASLYKEFFGKKGLGTKRTIIETIKQFLEHNFVAKVVEVHGRMAQRRVEKAKKKPTPDGEFSDPASDTLSTINPRAR